MTISYLITWATILRVAATELSQPIVSFDDAAQAMYHQYLQWQQGINVQVITNNGTTYWLVSATLAAKLYKANFYPVLSTLHLPE